MQSKSLLIAIAAFAVTTTGVQAYGGTKILNRAGLSENQIEAIEEARELKSNGKTEKARDILLEAGVTEDTLKSIHRAVVAAKEEFDQALEAGDWSDFKALIADSPLADIITSEQDFALFQEAQILRLNGDWEEAEEILAELGLDKETKPWHYKARNDMKLSQLSQGEREAVRVAKEHNDKETLQTIFKNAGLD